MEEDFEGGAAAAAAAAQAQEEADAVRRGEEIAQRFNDWHTHTGLSLALSLSLLPLPLWQLLNSVKIEREKEKKG